MREKTTVLKLFLLLVGASGGACTADSAKPVEGDESMPRFAGASNGDSGMPGERDGLVPDFSGAERVDLVHVPAFPELERDAGLIARGVDEGDVTFAVREGRGYVLHLAELGCSDPYEAMLLREGPDAHVLLRFTGPGHNACGTALYAMRVAIGAADANMRVTVYRQDEVAGPVAAVGSASAGPSDADCGGLVECSADAPCVFEGASSEVLGGPVDVDDTYGCVTLDVCDKSACAWRGEACMMTCGELDCAVTESFPMEVSCLD